MRLAATLRVERRRRLDGPGVCADVGAGWAACGGEEGGVWRDGQRCGNTTEGLLGQASAVRRRDSTSGLGWQMSVVRHVLEVDRGGA